MKHTNIIPLNVAIDSKIAINKFYVASDNAYSSLKDTMRKNILFYRYVATLPFDLISNILGKIDFIKIDVEGFEHSVLLSMERLLKKDKPTLFVEIYRGANSNNHPEETIKFLVNIGYSAFFVNSDGILHRYSKHNDNFYNYFFIYSERSIV